MQRSESSIHFSAFRSKISMFNSVCKIKFKLKLQATMEFNGFRWIAKWRNSLDTRLNV